jgi:predicted CoA-binding protein
VKNPSRAVIKTVLEQAERIAIVGISDNPERTSYQIAEALLKDGYEIIPVNPHIDEVFGIKAVDKLTNIDGKIDIVNVFRRHEFVKEVAEQTVLTNANVFWTQLGLWHEEAGQLVKDSGKTVIMDRCIKVEHALLIKN